LTIFLYLASHLSNCLAQDSSHFSPYIGLSANFEGIAGKGWGSEAGLHFRTFYMGLEYGDYGYVDIAEPASGSSVPSAIPTSTESYYGLHGGIVWNGSFYTGVAVLYSIQTWAGFG